MGSVARRARPLFSRCTALIAVGALGGVMSIAGLTVSAPAFAADPIATVPLGAAGSFGVLTSAAVGNTATGPITTIRGDLGAGGGQTGFPPGVVTGSIYLGAQTAVALDSLQVAYANAQGRAPGALLSATVGGTTAGPGVHTSVAAIAN
ncbi:MAG TPA: hypothetical protein VMM60_13590, partial [Ilumatobacter sp.]|nr:hypothetical protein [Ilumatobacter sp.]